MWLTVQLVQQGAHQYYPAMLQPAGLRVVFQPNIRCSKWNVLGSPIIYTIQYSILYPIDSPWYLLHAKLSNTFWRQCEQWLLLTIIIHLDHNYLKTCNDDMVVWFGTNLVWLPVQGRYRHIGNGKRYIASTEPIHGGRNGIEMDRYWQYWPFTTATCQYNASTGPVSVCLLGKCQRKLYAIHAGRRNLIVWWSWCWSR